MKKVMVVLNVLFWVFGSVGFVLAGAHLEAPGPMDPKGIETVHMAYENNTFTPGKPFVHLPGVDLAGPGDSYRYTIIRDDKYANDPNYEIVNAIIGVHIDDYDANKEGDRTPEWGKILLNGKPMTTVKLLPFDTMAPQSTKILEMVSDLEFSPEPDKKLFPPYIFNVTELFKKQKDNIIEVINLRQDGSIEGDAPFGDFVINRIGCHVWYKKK